MSGDKNMSALTSVAPIATECTQAVKLDEKRALESFPTGTTSHVKSASRAIERMNSTTLPLLVPSAFVSKV